MIIFGEKSSFKNAEIGDTFCVIDYGRWSLIPISVFTYTVKQVGKRDIKCVSKSGIELTVKVENTYKNPTAYEPGGKEYKDAIELIALSKRQKNCAEIVDSRTSGKSFDNELMDAIEAFEKRKEQNGAF